MSRAVWCLAIVLTVSAGSLMQAAPTLAAYQWDGFQPYTWGNSGCSGSFKDPINYFFNTKNEGLGEEPVAKGYIAGWPVYWPVSGPFLATDQYMWSSNSGCHIQDHQMAQSYAGPKYHTRLRQGPWVSDYWGYSTAAPMHHDSLTTCGDSADSFNSARDYAYAKFRDAGFSQQQYWVGNTQAMTQCDGRVTAGDGYIWENHGY